MSLERCRIKKRRKISFLLNAVAFLTLQIVLSVLQEYSMIMKQNR